MQVIKTYILIINAMKSNVEKYLIFFVFLFLSIAKSDLYLCLQTLIKMGLWKF